jgi:hypothetical protein
MHFTTAVESTMDKSITSLLLQMAGQTKSTTVETKSMAALTSTIANLEAATNEERIEKYKCDLSN